MVLVGMMRPYYVVLLLVGLLAAWVVDMVVGYLFRCRLSWRTLANQCLLVVMTAVLLARFKQTVPGVVVYSEASSSFSRVYAEEVGWKWNKSEKVPLLLEGALRRASELRVQFVVYGRQLGAGSEIDGDRLPDDALSALAYMPRALFVGLMAPFPDTWGERVTAPRLIGAMETAVWYLFALGVAVLAWRRPSRELSAGLVFSGTLLTILAYTYPNIGSLYRQRYGLWHLFLLCGSVGWLSLMVEYLRRRQNSWGGAGALSIANRGD